MKFGVGRQRKIWMRTFMRKKTFQALKGRIFPTIVGDRSKNSAHVAEVASPGLNGGGLAFCGAQ
jgi:hypothetical protein